jgi:thiol-disulfide isomerase/thioredoxin
MIRATMMILALAAAAAGSAPAASPAPDFTHVQPAEWINSEPLALANLAGRVVLVEFWTFDCINCRRSLPWLEAVHARYRDAGLVIVGVHSPELARERDADNVRAAVKQLGIEYAVMLDPDFSTWKAFGNRYWPAFYLIDRQGRIAATVFGELHDGTARGDAFEQEIRRLLAVRG